MTHQELDQIITDDPYLQARKEPSEADIRLYLREVDFHCPLCKRELQNRFQKKSRVKLFEIAHIYPNRPTIEQYTVLKNVERLGESSESFENKIALCHSCHTTQDFHTTVNDYQKLLNIKKRCLLDTALNNMTLSLGLEEEIGSVISKIIQISEKELVELNYIPVPLAKKFSSTELTLKAKISGYVYTYYPLVRDYLQQLDGKNGFLLEVLAGQIKICFLKMNTQTDDKSAIFNHIVQWVKNKSSSSSLEACEAVVAYFVQNCEVFYEITE